MKPAGAQIKEFWERYGLRVEIRQDRYSSGWHSWELWTKDGVRIDTPELDLNNLFKYAVTFLEENIKTRNNVKAERQQAVMDLLVNWVRDIFLLGLDPALSLFWVIWESQRGEE